MPGLRPHNQIMLAEACEPRCLVLKPVGGGRQPHVRVESQGPTDSYPEIGLVVPK